LLLKRRLFAKIISNDTWHTLGERGGAGMTKARLIKRHEIKEIEAEKEAGLKEEKKNINKRLGDDLGLVVGAKRDNRRDPRKAFAELFTQP